MLTFFLCPTIRRAALSHLVLHCGVLPVWRPETVDPADHGLKSLQLWAQENLYCFDLFTFGYFHTTKTRYGTFYTIHYLNTFIDSQIYLHVSCFFCLERHPIPPPSASRPLLLPTLENLKLFQESVDQMSCCFPNGFLTISICYLHCLLEHGSMLS